MAAISEPVAVQGVLFRQTDNRVAMAASANSVSHFAVSADPEAEIL